MFKIELKEDRVTAGLNRLALAMTDLSEPMADIGELMVQSTKDRFTEGVAPDGARWAPKSPTTIDAYQRRGDGVLIRPLFGPSNRLSTEISYQAGPGSVQWGSSLIYAGVMQHGAQKGAFGSAANDTPIPWGDIPARPFLGLSDDDRVSIEETIGDWLERASAAKD